MFQVHIKDNNHHDLNIHSLCPKLGVHILEYHKLSVQFPNNNLSSLAVAK